MHARDGVNQAALVIHGSNSVEFRLERTESLGLNGFLVHAGAIVIANLLIASAPAWTPLGCLFQNVVQNGLVPLIYFNETRPFRLVRRNFRLFHPVATRILIEIGARIHALINVVNAEAC